jgi:hypothetical protein
MNLLGKLLIVASLPLTLTALHKDSGAINTIEVLIRGNRVAKLFSCTGSIRTTGDRSTAPSCLAWGWGRKENPARSPPVDR